MLVSFLNYLQGGLTMKRIISAVALTLFTAGTTFAVSDVISLPAKNGNVAFPHSKHMEVKQSKGCKACHDKETGGKIAGLGKDWAHKTCKGCHEEMKKGPVKCGDCHKK
jgi:predicted CXXCH cytochrome family protein